MGGFPGRFSALPYYVKVQEYSNMESRDLWEYALDFTDAEMARMLANIWELDQTHFDYYFLSENCSYHLLSLLEVARPSLHLRDAFPVQAIPTDTLKETLRHVGSKGPPVYRPSHTRIMTTRYHLMTRDEVHIAEHLVDDKDWHPELAADLPPERRALTLDAAADYLKYEHGFSPGQDTAANRPERKREFAILRERGKVSSDGPPLDVQPATAPPETGHESARFGFGGGVTNRGRAFGELSWRAALHDLLDRQDGYIPNSHIEMPLLVLRLRPDRLNGPDGGSSVVLDKLDLVSITSLTAHNGWVNLPSWRVAFGAERLRDLGNCDTWHCVAADVHGGIGYALGSNIFSGEVWYGFIDLNVWGRSALCIRIYRIAPDAALGTAMQVTSFWRVTPLSRAKIRRT